MTGLEAVREALLLSGDSSCVAVGEGAHYCSAYRGNLAQLLSCQQSTFHCTGSRGDRVAAPLNSAGETTFTETPKRQHIPRMCEPFAITH